MPTRPAWSGSIQISLVSIAVRIFPASNPPRSVEFHQIDRKTHHRIHHQNVDESGAVAREDIVKGFEYAKNKYIEIDPDELKALRIPTAQTMEIRQFVDESELPPSLYDRPYFVAPNDEAQAKALNIMRDALRTTGKLGIGEVAFSGREHLAAIAAPADPKQKGLMLYVLRYEEELRESKPAVGYIPQTKASSQELALAKQLIEGSSSRFNLSVYRDDYEAAVKKLVDAKRKGKPLPAPETQRKPEKVVNIMDALRKSLAATGEHPKKRQPSKRKKAA
ncbi:MAG TPA: Ku protein [Acidobacteriaceae bacterium]|jgi:DNA end-binding protein Ku|nr:Ku protein [Acidobacteriaceae bacterium]